MLPPGGKDDPEFTIIIVGISNGDPHPEHKVAIEVLGTHLGLTLDRPKYFPYAE